MNDRIESALKTVKTQLRSMMGILSVDDAILETQRDVYSRKTMLVLTTKFVEEVLDPQDSGEARLIVHVPTSWWQHFKVSVFPQWALKRFPVKYHTVKRTVKFNVSAIYPKCDRAIEGGMGPSIIYVDVPDIVDDFPGLGTYKVDCQYHEEG